ncbi:Mucin-12 [Aspergillus brasiliensis]|uniref:Mucin-12 n=1 Tax=Aspergillus brasiliensis TaxID=319629 RepID=A0A9W6DRH5_9EURO|nr:Mucin-12 [Aspergillus brasiliensis]GKZ50256.1 Mucin-12 [Aspergillus brasiliensis]
MNLQQAIQNFFSVNIQQPEIEDAISRSHLVAHKFREIPRCSLNCLFPLILSTCSHTDYTCLCTNLPTVTATAQFESCFHQCPINHDQRETPNSLLSLCNLFDIHPTLPEYMTPNINLDRRGEYINELRTIYSIVTTIYASTQSTSEPTSTEDPLATATAGVISSIDPDDTTTTIAPTTSSNDNIATTTSQQQPNIITITETRLISTMYMPSATTQTSSPDNNNTNTSGLSTGAKAGIGVAVPLAVALIALLAFLWFQRRRRKMKQQQQSGDINTSEESGQVTTIQQTEGKDNTTLVLPEIDGAPLNESDSRPVHDNSSDRPVVFELSTGSVRKPRRGDTSQGVSGARDVIGVEDKQGTAGEVASSGSATLGEAPAELSSDVVRDGESTASASASAVAYERMSSSELQEELARVARSKERLRYLQTLEEKEDVIRRVLAGQGEDAVSGGGGDNS